MQNTENNLYESKLNNLIPFLPEGDFYFTKGVESFQKGKFDIAIKWLNKAIEAVPNDPLYQCQMSIIYTEIGDYHSANQLLKKVLLLTEDNYVDCYYFLANNYAHLGLLNDAKKNVESYLIKEPIGDFSEEAKSLLDLFDMDEGDFELENEDELLIYQELVFSHMEHLEWKEALPLLEEMLTLFPEHIMTKHDYTHALFFSGDEEDAIEQELDLLQKDPNSLYSYVNLSIYYYELNQKQDYERTIQVLRNVYPIHEQQKLRVAITLARTGNFQEAYYRFQTLVKGLVKNHLSYYRWYSIAAFQVGEIEMATKLWNKGCKRYTKLSKEEVPWRL